MALYAFDGTCNEDEEGTDRDSNVVKFRDAYIGSTFYLAGVGTRLGWIGKFAGGLFGLGGRRRVKEAMEALDTNFQKGDRVIDIVGFSRGAAIARHFANQVMEEERGAEIRFLGIWDTVASFGIPGNEINIGWEFTLPGNVRKCYHAMALDERRQGFPLTRVEAGIGAPPTSGRLREVWFRGVHSDVGGGEKHRTLQHQPLLDVAARPQEQPSDRPRLPRKAGRFMPFECTHFKEPRPATRSVPKNLGE